MFSRIESTTSWKRGRGKKSICLHHLHHQHHHLLLLLHLDLRYLLVHMMQDFCIRLEWKVRLVVVEIWLFGSLFDSFAVWLVVCLFVCLFVSLSLYLSISLSPKLLIPLLLLLISHYFPTTSSRAPTSPFATRTLY